jgi:hypothetical protein
MKNMKVSALLLQQLPFKKQVLWRRNKPKVAKAMVMPPLLRTPLDWINPKACRVHSRSGNHIKPLSVLCLMEDVTLCVQNAPGCNGGDSPTKSGGIPMATMEKACVT